MRGTAAGQRHCRAISKGDELKGEADAAAAQPVTDVDVVQGAFKPYAGGAMTEEELEDIEMIVQIASLARAGDEVTVKELVEASVGLR